LGWARLSLETGAHPTSGRMGGVLEHTLQDSPLLLHRTDKLPDRIERFCTPLRINNIPCRFYAKAKIFYEIHKIIALFFGILSYFRNVAIRINIDLMMAKRKMSLTELSQRVGISMTNLSLLKTGKVKGIRFGTLEAICRELDCQPGDVLEYVPDSV
jgi:putative transcriptional regulator